MKKMKIPSRQNKSEAVAEPQTSLPATASSKAAPAPGSVPATFGLKEILVPVDFSEPSRSTLRYASALANQFQAKLTLLYVVQPITYPYDFGVAFPLVMETKDAVSDAK